MAENKMPLFHEEDDDAVITSIDDVPAEMLNELSSGKGDDEE